MRNFFKKITILKFLVVFYRTMKAKPGLLKRMVLFSDYLSSYGAYKKISKNDNYKLEFKDLYPRIYDKTEITDLDPVYYLQGVWCARKIFDNKPIKHHDIGSQALMVGIISQFIPTTMVDIRPLSVTLPELSFVKGDVTKLPFPDNSISSLSSMCVIEHIGLGRYGDPLDQFGTEKAASELSRVLSKDGFLYISAPVDNENKVYFNAHRAFTRDYILKLFKNLELVEEKYIYGKELKNIYDDKIGFGTGLYCFKK